MHGMSSRWLERMQWIANMPVKEMHLRISGVTASK